MDCVCLPLGVCGQEGEETGERCEQRGAPSSASFWAAQQHNTTRSALVTRRGVPIIAWLLRWPAPSGAQLVSVTMLSTVHHLPCWRLRLWLRCGSPLVWQSHCGGYRVFSCVSTAPPAAPRCRLFAVCLSGDYTFGCAATAHCSGGGAVSCAVGRAAGCVRSSSVPSAGPSAAPSGVPSAVPSTAPSGALSTEPSAASSAAPPGVPSSVPPTAPSGAPVCGTIVRTIYCAVCVTEQRAVVWPIRCTFWCAIICAVDSAVRCAER